MNIYSGCALDNHTCLRESVAEAPSQRRELARLRQTIGSFELQQRLESLTKFVTEVTFSIKIADQNLAKMSFGHRSDRKKNLFKLARTRERMTRHRCFICLSTVNCFGGRQKQRTKMYECPMKVNTDRMQMDIFFFFFFETKM